VAPKEAACEAAYGFLLGFWSDADRGSTARPGTFSATAVSMAWLNPRFSWRIWPFAVCATAPVLLSPRSLRYCLACEQQTLKPFSASRAPSRSPHYLNPKGVIAKPVGMERGQLPSRPRAAARRTALRQLGRAGEYEHGRLPPKARTGRPSANRGCVGGRIVRGDARVG
jgi:hypothetical protein